MQIYLQWVPHDGTTMNGIKLNHIYQSQITILCQVNVSSLFADCYHWVNVISLGLAQSLPIQRHLLYCFGKETVCKLRPLLYCYNLNEKNMKNVWTHGLLVVSPIALITSWTMATCLKKLRASNTSTDVHVSLLIVENVQLKFSQSKYFFSVFLKCHEKCFDRNLKIFFSGFRGTNVALSVFFVTQMKFCQNLFLN